MEYRQVSSGPAGSFISFVFSGQFSEAGECWGAFHARVLRDWCYIV